MTNPIGNNNDLNLPMNRNLNEIKMFKSSDDNREEDMDFL